MQDLPDGGALVDLRVRIAWAEAVDRCRVYEQLVPIPVKDYSGVVAPILHALEVTRQDFRAYCEASGFKLPAFWFTHEQAQRSAAAVSRCRTWLKELVRAGSMCVSR